MPIIRCAGLAVAFAVGLAACGGPVGMGPSEKQPDPRLPHNQ